MNKFNDGIAAVNGNFSPLSEAQIPLSDRGFLFGHAVFETILVSNGKIIAWEKHFERLQRSCKRSFIQQPEDNTLKQLVNSAIEQNIKLTKSVNSKIAVRIIVTGGNSFDLPISKNNENLPKANTIIICRNIPGPSQEQYLKGISLKSMADVRPKELVDIKSCNYLFNIMALEEARTQSYEDVLFYDNKNVFTECTTANFIWFDENYNVYSVPFENNCLAGTTLTLLVEALSTSPIQFQWKGLAKDEINSVFGCAILSSTRLILPVNKIDNTLFSIKKHLEFFRQLNELLEKKLQ